ncbi:hypothetical protein BEP19_11885 [Ammoniphilus oxalaticus]|uniref:NEAT domain-containing protein n=1 Tax=Ammoniphilus oxalaticus TaxID=66863 RepID=A0A419SGM5_9BACL|nr:stalk domain-containing protein [Ammoniphilus oxalaticus]RKD22926.1 hypothetical protein BEP19_11885 [Ammoniphilus oxalaticus]
MIKKLNPIHASLLAGVLCILCFMTSHVKAITQLANGSYSIQLKALKENSSEESRVQQSIEPNGELKVKDGKAVASITMKDSSDITHFKVEQQGAMRDVKVIESNAENNTRVVEFEVTDITQPVKAWVDIYIELPGLTYDQDYTIQLKFDPNSLRKIASSAATEGTSMNLLLYLFNKEAFSNGVAFQLSEAPYLKNDYTMVPARFISENLGAQVTWDDQSKVVSIERDHHMIQMKNGSSQVTVNGTVVTVDTAIEIKNGSTFVPLRFIAEQLGAEVKWDANQKSIAIVR